MSCPMHEQHEGSSHHAADVDTRGDKAMGFSHEKSTHHFELSSDGGTIEVTTNTIHRKIVEALPLPQSSLAILERETLPFPRRQ